MRLYTKNTKPIFIMINDVDNANNNSSFEPTDIDSNLICIGTTLNLYFS